jgi:cytidylate kinase
MKNKINIAIDGFSSCGKSTLAKQLANYLKYIYIDTGAMYRAVTLYAMNNSLINQTQLNKEKIINSLQKIEIDFKYNPQTKTSDTYLNGQNVENKIRSIEVSNLVSEISQIAEVRKMMVNIQQEISKNKGVVMDGRDIGTVVMPNAEIKLFMTASSEIRATRRFEEIKAKGENTSYQEILENVNKRDYLDQNRKESPLIQAPDAIVLDNSILTINDQFNIVIDIVKNKTVLLK